MHVRNRAVVGADERGLAMPRVHQVRAAKNHSRFGIKKGDLHYTWKIRTGRTGTTYRSLNRPRPSQLTGSDKKSRLYAAQEACEDLANKEGGLKKEDLEFFQEAFEYGVSEAEEVQSEYEDAACACEGGLNEKFERMAESADAVTYSFQEQVDRVEEIISEVEEKDFDKDDLDGLLFEAAELVSNLCVEIEE